MFDDQPREAPTSEEVCLALRHCWQPVARLEDLAHGPQRAVLLGEALAVFLAESGKAAVVADRVLEAVEMLVDIDGKVVYPRASIGICMGDVHAFAYDAEELLRNADVAMYMAKRDSKGSYRLFEPAMHERVLERLELQAELQQAIELQQFEVYYQPVVRLTSGHQNHGVEALLAREGYAEMLLHRGENLFADHRLDADRADALDVGVAAERQEAGVATADHAT